MKHLQSSKNCPQCGVKVHETQPLLHLRPDRTMQDIVYKLVPHLFESKFISLQRRQEFCLYNLTSHLFDSNFESQHNIH